METEKNNYSIMSYYTEKEYQKIRDYAINKKWSLAQTVKEFVLKQLEKE